MVQVRWPRWPPCQYMLKTFKNLLRNQKTDDLETWYAALGTRVLPNLFKCPGLTLAYFTARSNLVPCAIVWEKVKTIDFPETIVVYDIKVDRWSQLNEYMKHYKYQRSRSFTDLGPSHSDAIFSTSFPQKPLGRLKQSFIWSLLGMVERKIVQMVQVTWPRWSPCPYKF